MFSIPVPCGGTSYWAGLKPWGAPAPCCLHKQRCPLSTHLSAGLVLPGAGGRWTPRRSHLGTPHGAAGWGHAWSTSLCHCKQPPAHGISASKAARPCPKQVLCFGSNSKEDWSGYQQPNSLLKQKSSVSKQITTLLFLLSQCHKSSE